MKKRGVASEYLPWVLIAVAVLVIVVLFLFFLKNSGFSLIDKLKILFRG